MESVINLLKGVKGLVKVFSLEAAHKEELLKKELEENHGIRECLSKKQVLVLVHDSSFRDPAGPLVKIYEDTVVFPSVPFPELDHVRAISASPSKNAHEFLMKTYNLEENDEYATIIVGFDEVQR